MVCGQTNETSKWANTHTLTLRLTPVWNTAEGVLLSDCALESTGPVDNTLGPQAVLITDTDTVNSPPPVPGSMNHLGLPLATQWQPPDLPSTRTWWEKAADAGHPEAMCNLAVLLATQGEPRDLPTARAWAEKATKTRCRRSQLWHATNAVRTTRKRGLAETS